MSTWLVWLIFAVALGIGEMFTLTFVLAMFGAGAGAAALVSGLGASGPVDGAVFGVVSVAGLIVVLPIARRHRHGPGLRTGTAALVGQNGRTLTEVTHRDGGRVQIGGETWTAAPYDESVIIPADTPVDVLAISGATAVIHPRDLPLGSAGMGSGI